MAFKLRHSGLTAGQVVYALRFNEAGLAWDGDSFEAFTGVHADFDGASATVDSAGVYLSTPNGPAGYAKWELWLRSGEAPDRAADVMLREIICDYYDATDVGSKILVGSFVPDAISAASVSDEAAEKIANKVETVLGDEATLLVSTTIATLTSQTEFTLSAGSADNDAYNNALIVITDQSTVSQKTFGIVSDYVGSTKTVTLSATPKFTIAAGDSVSIVASDGVMAANAVTISPVVSMVMPTGQLISQPITVRQYETFASTFVILDENQEAINDAGDSFTLVVYKLDKTTFVFQVSGLTAGGSGGNQVPFTIPDTNTATAGTYFYRLWNTTKDRVRAENSFEIAKGAQPT